MELLPLVCLCLLSCSGETSAAGDGVKVVVKEDDDAVLPCSLSTKEDITGQTFDWKKDARQEVFMYVSGIITSKDEQFKDRVSHFEDQLKNGNASIKIIKTKMADSGTYSCIFPHLQPRQTFNIELVVGLAPEPNIKTLDHKPDRILLQCEAHGDPPLTVEWMDSDNNTLPAEERKESKQGRYSYITLKITVTKTDNYSCVATQKENSHQIAAVIPVHIQGSNTGLVTALVVFIALFVAAVIVAGVVAVLYVKNRNKQNHAEDEEKREPQSEPNSSTSLKEST